MNRLFISLFSVLLLFCSTFSFAHHSRFGVFDTNATIDIEGTLSYVKWSNPHVLFEAEVIDSDGVMQVWHIETTALSMLRSRGLDQNFLKVGDRVRIAGHPTYNGDPELLGMNLLLPDGTEVLITRNSTPYFANLGSGQFLESVYDTTSVDRARAEADGIFRTWSTVLTDLASFPMFRGRYPLNETAAQIKASWDPDPEQQLSCWAKDMPILMVTPHPIEFSQVGENIRMRFEEDDAERLVHMNIENSLENIQSRAASSMGYSTGSWEGNTLVVETTNIDAAAFDDQGTPVGDDLRLVERFTLSDDEKRLDYRITFYDDETFTEPFDLTRYWVWRPERAVEAWGCE